MASPRDMAGQIDAYLKSKGSPMAGLGNVFVAAGRKYGVDPRLTVAIAGAESSFGKYNSGANNAWGWNPGSSFANWNEGISTVTRGLKNYYIDYGRLTPLAIASHGFLSKKNGDDFGAWANTVSTFMTGMGGSPQQLTITPQQPVVSSPPAANVPTGTKTTPTKPSSTPAVTTVKQPTLPTPTPLASSLAPMTISTPLADTTVSPGLTQLDSATKNLQTLSQNTNLLSALIGMANTQPAQTGAQTAAMQTLATIAQRGRVDPNQALQDLSSGLATDAFTGQQSQNQQDVLASLAQSLGTQQLTPVPAIPLLPKSPASPASPASPKLPPVTPDKPALTPAVTPAVTPLPTGPVGPLPQTPYGPSSTKPPPEITLTPPAGSTAAPPSSSAIPPVRNIGHWVQWQQSPPANRAGVPVHAPVIAMVDRIAQIAGHPLVIGTGTAHNQFVSGTNNTRQSDHWTGWAVDIPAYGNTLTDLGRSALIAAGMLPEEALRQNGGLYNVNGYQVIFNIDLAQGGNHWNHLHFGFRPERQH